MWKAFRKGFHKAVADSAAAVIIIDSHACYLGFVCREKSADKPDNTRILMGAYNYAVLLCASDLNDSADQPSAPTHFFIKIGEGFENFHISFFV